MLGSVKIMFEEFQSLSRQIIISLMLLLFFCFGFFPVYFSANYSPSYDLIKNYPLFQIFGIGFLIVFILFILNIIKKELKITSIAFYAMIFISLLNLYVHYFSVDQHHLEWQVNQYCNIIYKNYGVPHQYRFVPYGILWWFVLFSGNYIISLLMYRFLFQYVLLAIIWKLASIYNDKLTSVFILFVYAAFYPLSIHLYSGQIIDPIFHLLFVLGLFCSIKKLYLPLIITIILGMFSKESIILLCPMIFILYPSKSHFKFSFFLITLALILFFLIRLYFGFDFSLEKINGVSQLMFYSNLGFSKGMAKSVFPIYLRYLHPIIFVWIPFFILMFYNKFISRNLFYSCAYISFSIYITNTLFGWNHESRNFIPGFIFNICILIFCIKKDYLKKIRKHET